MQEDDQKILAHQLSCPHGEKGLEVASLMEKSNFQLTMDTLNNLDLAPDLCVGEIGIGNGNLSKLVLEKIGPKGSYHGFDLSQDMIDLAKSNLSHSGFTNIHFYPGDFSQLEHNIILDRLFAVNVLYFIKDLDLFFKKVAHYLKPSGQACFGIRTAETLAKIPFTKYNFEIREDNFYMSAIDRCKFSSVELIQTIELNKSDKNRQIQLDFDFHNTIFKITK